MLTISQSLLVQCLLASYTSTIVPNSVHLILKLCRVSNRLLKASHIAVDLLHNMFFTYTPSSSLSSLFKKLLLPSNNFIRITYSQLFSLSNSNLDNLYTLVLDADDTFLTKPLPLLSFPALKQLTFDGCFTQSTLDWISQYASTVTNLSFKNINNINSVLNCELHCNLTSLHSLVLHHSTSFDVDSLNLSCFSNISHLEVVADSVSLTLFELDKLSKLKDVLFENVKVDTGFNPNVMLDYCKLVYINYPDCVLLFKNLSVFRNCRLEMDTCHYSNILTLGLDIVSFSGSFYNVSLPVVPFESSLSLNLRGVETDLVFKSNKLLQDLSLRCCDKVFLEPEILFVKRLSLLDQDIKCVEKFLSKCPFVSYLHITSSQSAYKQNKHLKSINFDHFSLRFLRHCLLDYFDVHVSKPLPKLLELEVSNCLLFIDSFEPLFPCLCRLEWLYRTIDSLDYLSTLLKCTSCLQQLTIRSHFNSSKICLLSFLDLSILVTLECFRIFWYGDHDGKLSKLQLELPSRLKFLKFSSYFGMFLDNLSSFCSCPELFILIISKQEEVEMFESTIATYPELSKRTQIETRAQ
ncbi:hypothetical protein RCL1_008218 [Eukaryota sp. TZLM3-RCL]